MNKFVQWVINISAGVFFFFFFLLLSFPFDNLIQNALSQMEKQTGGKYRITVSHIDPNILFPSVFKDFQIHQKDDSGDKMLVNFPEVKLGVNYLPLMASKLKASFKCKGKSGKTMEGRFFISQSETSFDAKLKDLRFSDIPAIKDAIVVDLDGSVSGDASGSFFAGQPAKNEAELDLKIKNLVMPAGVIPKTPLELPEPLTLAGKDGGTIKMTLEKSKVEVKEFSLPGEDVVLNVSGTVQVNPRIAFSRLNLNGTLQFSQKTETALGVFVAIIAKEKNEQGLFPISIAGRANKPIPKIGNFNLSSFQPSDMPEE